jgi:hypothetical protein
MILDKDRLASVYGENAPWFLDHIPFFECPDQDIQEIYYFRWGVYRQHIRPTGEGHVITEFLPDVPWAGIYNSISCAAGHHFYEGRWLRNPEYLRDYAFFWLRGPGEPRRYSFPVADALYAFFLATGDDALAIELLPDLIRVYEDWEAERLDPTGLFWQIDDREGQEYSIGGSGCRPLFNSTMYGDARAIAHIATRAGDASIAQLYQAKAVRIKALVQQRLWDPEARFFKTLCNEQGARHHSEGAPVYRPGELVDVRELQGYVPWYFGLPDPGYEVAWQQLLDPQGFWGPFGPTTAERRHPYFMFEHPHECLWNGPSWPFATTHVLGALANLLNNYRQAYLGKAEYLHLLQVYARSQHLTMPDGTVVPWIDENLHPDTGEWLARDILYRLGRADRDRGRNYNHSGYCDPIITGLVGIRPRPDGVLVVNPLVPHDAWDYFCLEDVPYHGRLVTVVFDKSGERYRRGRGLRILIDGEEVAHVDTPGRVAIEA